MPVQISSTAWNEIEVDCLIIPLFEESPSQGTLTELNSVTGELVARVFERKDFTAKLAEMVTLYEAPGIKAPRLCLLGLGKQEKLDGALFKKAVMTVVRQLAQKKETSIAFAPSIAGFGNLEVADCLQTIAIAIEVGAYGQDIYREEAARHSFESSYILADEAWSEVAHAGSVIGEGINITREVVNLPANAIYPQTFAERAQEVAETSGMKCRVLDEDMLAEEQMGSMLAVAQGSDNPARLVVFEYRGAGENDPVLGLVGKGVTFDSGGLSLKPSQGMIDMKCDMAGAGTVLGAMAAIARLKLPVNVNGYMGLVENMVSGSSYKLGDVLTARNGLTIEVLNTDAEGRLVLADVLNYAVDDGVSKIIDLATLTGACMVALGIEISGMFSNDSEWSGEIKEASLRANENVWEMPMFDHFADLLKSDVAEVKNIGTRWGGAITAAKFLEKFVNETPWTHLDIAGPSFKESSKPHEDGGATGVMVQTLVEVAKSFGK